MCEKCGEHLDGQAHLSACDIVTTIKQRKRDGVSIGSYKCGDVLISV